MREKNVTSSPRVSCGEEKDHKKVGRVVLGILFRRIRVHSLSFPPRWGLSTRLPKPHRLAAEQSTTSAASPSRSLCAGRSFVHFRRRSADPPSRSSGARYQIGLVCCFLMLVVSIPSSLGWILPSFFFPVLSGGLVPWSKPSSS